MTLAPSNPASVSTSTDPSPSSPRSSSRHPKRVPARPVGRGKFGPKPRSNSEKALLYLNKIDSFTASSHDVAHVLGFSGNWAPVQAVSVLEQLVRGGKIKKMKANGETRYAHL